MRDRYIITLLIVAALIVLPACFARMFGASINILAAMAAFQLLALLAFFVTSLVSLALGIKALMDKRWKKAAAYGVAMIVPAVAYCLAHSRIMQVGRPSWEYERRVQPAI